MCDGLESGSALPQEPTSTGHRGLDALVVTVVLAVVFTGVLLALQSPTAPSKPPEKQPALARIPQVLNADFESRVLKADKPVLVWIMDNRTDQTTNLQAAAFLHGSAQACLKGQLSICRIDGVNNRAMASTLLPRYGLPLPNRYSCDVFVIVKDGKVTASLNTASIISPSELEHFIKFNIGNQ